MGMLYQRGEVWWLKYYRNGKSIRESAKTTSKMVAEKILKRREGEIAQGKIPGYFFDKVTYEELAEGFLLDYRINNKKSIIRAERSVGHLTKHFGGMKGTQITTPTIQSYIISRLEAGAANATINRELSALKRMLNLGAKQTPPLVDRVPHIPMLRENNTRKGFFEHDEFLALREALPTYLKGFVTFAYKTGWRDDEINNLTWAQVDLKQGIVRLEAGQTKNDEGRTVFLDDELLEVFRTQFTQRNLGRPYVFHNKGVKINDFRFAWNVACRKAKLGYGYKKDKGYVAKWAKKLPPGPIMHDFRRTAVRNLIRAGVPERVAMMISGHKTRSVFDRYNIVNLDDLKMAALKQASYLAERDIASTPRAQFGHNLPQIDGFAKK